MKPAVFEYRAPTSLDEVVAPLAAEPAAKVIAGRQSLTAPDFPNLRAISLEHRPSPTNPLGVKGAGEGGIIPVGRLLANAVAGALSHVGAEPNVLPLSPPRVWRLANPGQ